MTAVAFNRLARAIPVVGLTLSLAGIGVSASSAHRAPREPEVSCESPGTVSTSRVPRSSAVRLVLNLPAFRLEAYIGGSLARTYRVAVGMPRYPTPRGTFEIRSIEWNPWWYPPNAPWARGQRVMPPGPGNPMGAAKLEFRPFYFIHGTPDSASLGRAASHGCVRMSNGSVIELARLIQEATLDPTTHLATLDRAAAGRTTAVALRQAVTLELRYDLVELRADSLLVHPDPYRLGSSPAATARWVLEAAGLDTGAVDYSRLRAMTRFPRATVALPVRRQ